MTLPNGDVVEYLIDGEHRRVARKKNGVLEKAFLYSNDGRLVAELDGAQSLKSRFVYGTKGHVPDYMIKDGVDYMIVTDHLGSVRLVVNASGSVVQRIDYGEFGNVLADTNPGFQPFGFAGGLYDTETGLVRFGARDYDPVTGRWTSKDPILFAGGDTNLYGYTFNDPVNWIDSDGLSAKDVSRIREIFMEEVGRMTRAGQRRSPGWLNNMSRTANDVTGGMLGSPYLGCGEQSDVLQNRLSNQKYDDSWTFEWDGLFDPFPHQRIRARSSNPNDPVLIIDPHRDRFTELYGPSRP